MFQIFLFSYFAHAQYLNGLIYKKDEKVYKRGEIIMNKIKDGMNYYYVHFTDYNKRLDDWVTIDLIDLNSIEKTSTEQKKDKKKSSVSSNFRKRKLATIDEGKTIDEEKDSNVIPTTGSIRSAAEQANESAITKVRNIHMIHFGKYQVQPWYFAPYPIECQDCEILYICEFCLCFRTNKTAFLRHLEKCKKFHPPGKEIYRKIDISFFEIDGRIHKDYCQNLCLLSKLFLDHKTVYYDTEPFKFYVMTQISESGFHLLGYFSKEKESTEDYNLACILTMPQYQRLGYGKVLIDFSYLLNKVEGKSGHPEKPFSDLGLLSYRSYWTQTLTRILLKQMESFKRAQLEENEPDENLQRPSITINELINITSIRKEDVISTLQYMGILHYYKGQFVICISEKQIESFHASEAKRNIIIDPQFLNWFPSNKK